MSLVIQWIVSHLLLDWGEEVHDKFFYCGIFFVVEVCVTVKCYVVLCLALGQDVQTERNQSGNLALPLSQYM